MTFVDEAKIYVKAGDGGKGCESFSYDTRRRHPRPTGGDGGRGGDIVFIATKSIQTLLDYRFKQHYKAERGGHASSRGKKGKEGKDHILKIPVGTLVRDHKTNLVIRDLIKDGQKVLVAKGGNGGRGNEHKHTPKPPDFGEEKVIQLELKLIADIGIIGFPNAGKSTFITKVSKVRSKIASYHFTTKQPILGIVEGEDFNFVIADLPGLIEGAHKGKGLGDRFLRHAERTEILLHMIDMGSSEGRNPIEDYAKINDELQQYSDKLFFKHKVVVANKMDLPKAEENLRKFKRVCRKKVFPISALNREGCDELVEFLRNLLSEKKLIAS